MSIEPPRHDPIGRSKAFPPPALAAGDTAWPAFENDEVLLVRKLPAHDGQPGVGPNACEEARRAVHHAVDGWLARAGAATAVRFSSRASLLACLVRDLLAGRNRWYWRPWSDYFRLPAGRAIARLICDHTLYWPAVIRLLETRDVLADVWLALEPDDARMLLVAIATSTGWRLDAAPADKTRGPCPQPTAPDWLTIAAAIQVGRPTADAAVLRLAVVSWLWCIAPHRLAGSDAAYAVGKLANTLLRRFDVARLPNLVQTDEAPAGPASGLPADRAPEIPRGIVATPPVGASAPQQLEAGSLSETPFVTPHGGWFLLLNALALPAVQHRLDSSDGCHAGPWWWLHRLGCALGGAPDAALARFFCNAARLADAAFHQQPPLPDEPALVRLIANRYGDALCNAGLMARPALVVATPSHLDVHFRMDDRRPDLRRAALDVNPGWLPWLGRVVSFHYGEPTGPRASASR